jgi:hypothetical protein
MELFDLMTKKPEFPVNFPDKSLLEGLVTEHRVATNDESRRIWVDGGFLHGYLALFKMQYDEIRRIANILEQDNAKQKKMNGKLLKEIERLNKTLDAMHRTNEQLHLDFDTLRTRIEYSIKQNDNV